MGGGDLKFTDEELKMLAEHWAESEERLLAGSVGSPDELTMDLVRRGATPALIERFHRLRAVRNTTEDELTKRFDQLVDQVRNSLPGRETSN